MTIAFDQERWQEHEAVWRAWWQHELDRPIVTMWTELPPTPGQTPAPHFTSNFPLDTPAAEVIDLYGADLARQRFFGDAWPKWWPNFGPGVMAACLGSPVKTAPDTVWFEPVAETDLAAWNLRLDNDNRWQRRIVALTEAARQRWGETVNIGLTDMGGNLDILASLRGSERLLMDLLDQPDQVERLAGQITQLWLQYYDTAYDMVSCNGRGCTGWWPLWAPGKSYMLQCDFSYMIAPEMFARFVLPDLRTCCEHLDYAFYHLDGKGEIPHLDHLLGLERLRGIQWVPGAGAPMAEHWPDLLRRIIEAGKLCQVFVTRAGALKIAEEIGGRGFVFHIGDPVTDPAAAQEFLAALQRADRTR